MKRTLFLVPLLVLAAACGGGSSYSSASDVAKDLGCTSSYKHVAAADAEMFTSDAGHCQFNGEDVTINWFKNSDSLDHFTQVADQFGTRMLIGDNWVVECGGHCAQAKAKIGGKVD